MNARIIELNNKVSETVALNVELDRQLASLVISGTINPELMDAILGEYKILNDLKLANDKRVDALKSRVKEFMGSSIVLETDHYVATQQSKTSGETLDKAALLRDMGESFVAKYMRPGTPYKALSVQVKADA